MIVVVKGGCYMVIGGLMPLTTNLAQWANSGEWPSRINWVVIIAGCGVGAATQLLSFLSGSYSDYIKGRANGSASPGDSTATLASKVAARQAVYDALPKADPPLPPRVNPVIVPEQPKTP